MKRKRNRKIKFNKGKVRGKQDQEGPKDPKINWKKKRRIKRNEGKGKKNRTKEGPQEGPRGQKMKGKRKV